MKEVWIASLNWHTFLETSLFAPEFLFRLHRSAHKTLASVTEPLQIFQVYNFVNPFFLTTGSVKLLDKMATGTDEPMDDEHRKILKRCKGTLVKDMELGKVVLHMEDPLLFTTDEEDQIKSRDLTRQQQCEALLDMLSRKGAKAYDIFKRTIAIVHPHLTRTIIEAGK